MKKFINIRNILIILIIVIAIIFICFFRSSNIITSKSYQLFSTFKDYDIGDGYSNTMLTLNYSDENSEMTIIYATDYPNKREIYSIIERNKEGSEIDGVSANNYQLVGVITEDGLDAYYLYPNQKLCITYDTAQQDRAGYYASWVNDFTDEMIENSYYTKGYEFINGKLMYYEYFKETNLKLYFNNNELVYMKVGSLDNSISTTTVDLKDLNLYSVEISHDEFDNSLIEIPSEYEIKKSTEIE